MKKFQARVKLLEEENLADLLDTFFRNFNSQNSIQVSNGEAQMEICFDEPPMEVIKVITECEVVEFKYEPTESRVHLIEVPETSELKALIAEDLYGTEKAEETKASEPEAPVTENPEANVTEKIAVEEPEVSEPEKTVTETAETDESEKIAVKKTNVMASETLAGLEDIAKKANSFEHFAELIGELLGLRKKQKEKFVDLMIASTEVEVISWNELEEKFRENKKEFLNLYDKQQISKCISDKMSSTTLKFLKELKMYKGAFQEKKAEIKLENEPEAKNLINVKNYERIFEMVDKNQPVETRVCNVLGMMGINTLSQDEQKQFIDILKAAVKMKRMSWEEIFNKCGIPAEKRNETKVKLSAFVNGFLKRNENVKTVKVSEFFLDVQRYIMREEEISD